MSDKEFKVLGKEKKEVSNKKEQDSSNDLESSGFGEDAEESLNAYFVYINEQNTYHTAHVLKKIINSKPENLKYACLVVAAVDPIISEKLLAEFPDELKAEIISEIISLIQYSKKEIESFDKILRKLLTEQFGGKYVLAKILENLDIDKKLALSAIISSKYNENEKVFRNIMVLFEDVLKVNDRDYERIFGDVASEILSIAFCNQNEQQIEKLYGILPKGVKAIVQQGIDFGKKKNSKSEINKAQQYIVEFAKNLEKDGFIEPIIKE